MIAVEFCSLWSIVEVDKITAGLVLAQIKANLRGWPTTDDQPGVPDCLRIRPTLHLVQVASTLEEGIKNVCGLMRETMPLQTIFWFV